MPISIPKASASVSEQVEFASPLAGAGEASGGGWRLSDESATSKLLVYESFEPDGEAEWHLGVGFGAATTAGDGSLVCGVRPGEWLLLGGSPPSAPDMSGVVTVDMTHGLGMFRLAGPAATDVLAAVCSIDTTEAMFPDGAVCGASVARVACTLVRNDVAGERSYLILSQRSSGRYLFDAVRDAGVR
ncbi:MAG: hypothetical protein F4004_11875 [Acidimicrobiia bacterium]|nr:hypothetical protein [Acidimicrobiia bacterium]MYC43978.1 hypothetical protein [Acidimicrobiia bacterium]